MRLPRSLPFRPSASTRDPLQDFNSLLGRGQMGGSSFGSQLRSTRSVARDYPATPRRRPPRITRYKARVRHPFLIAPTALKSIQKETSRSMKCRSSNA
jgi:hypothetical protein